VLPFTSKTPSAQVGEPPTVAALDRVKLRLVVALAGEFVAREGLTSLTTALQMVFDEHNVRSFTRFSLAELVRLDDSFPTPVGWTPDEFVAESLYRQVP
jgi:hypothetical protein